MLGGIPAGASAGADMRSSAARSRPLALRLMRLFSAAALGLSLLAPFTAHAQSSASATVEVTASVLSPITITSVQGLAFGKVGQAVDKQIQPDDGTSGRFHVTGNGAAKVNVTITLPSVLTSSGNQLVIDTWTGKWSPNSDGTSGTAFTPVSGTAVPHTLPGTVDDALTSLHFRLGATVRPLLTQARGNYQAAIQIAAVYTEI